MASRRDKGIFKYGRSYVFKVVLVLSGLLGILLGAYWLSDVFTPLLFALVLAYILNPLVNALERRGYSRRRAVELLSILVVLLVALVLLVGVPILVGEVETTTEAVIGEEANPTVPLEEMRAGDGVPQRLLRARTARVQHVAVALKGMGGLASMPTETAADALEQWILPPEMAPHLLPSGTFVDTVAEPRFAEIPVPEDAPRAEDVILLPHNNYYDPEDLSVYHGTGDLPPGYFIDTNDNGRHDPGEPANRVVPPAAMRVAEGPELKRLRQAAIDTQLTAARLSGLPGLPLTAAHHAITTTDLGRMLLKSSDLLPGASYVDIPLGDLLGERQQETRTQRVITGYRWGTFDPEHGEKGNRLYPDDALTAWTGPPPEAGLPPGRYIDSNGNREYDPGYIERLRRATNDPTTWLGRLTDRIGETFTDGAVEDRAFVWMRNHAQEILARLPQTISTTFSSGVSAVNWVAALLIDLSLIPFYTFFFMLGLRDMRDTIYRYIPRDYRERAVEVIDHIHRVIAAFFRQRLIICLIIGAVTSIGFLICGLRFGLVLGLIIGLLSIVPFLSVIPMIPITFMVWADYDSAWWILGIWGVYAIGQSLDGILTPLIMGRDVELHPITLVVCLLIGGKIMGVLGMLLAIPLTASLKILAVEIVLPILREVADPTPASRERISLILSGRRSARDGPDGARQATPRLAGASSAPAQSPVAASSTRIEDGGLETASEGATSEQKPAEEQPTEAGASPDAESPSALPRIGPDEGR